MNIPEDEHNIQIGSLIEFQTHRKEIVYLLIINIDEHDYHIWNAFSRRSFYTLGKGFIDLKNILRVINPTESD